MRIVLVFSMLYLVSGATALAQSAVQPVSYLKETADISGFVAVAADTSGFYAVSGDGVRRFDSSGKQLWAQAFTTAASGLGAEAVSDAAGVYVLERLLLPGPQCTLFRFTIAGTRAWSRDLNLCSMAADQTGVYVYGPTTGGATQLIKYSPDNSELWRRDLAKGEVGFAFPQLAADLTGVYLVTANPAIAISVTTPAVIVRKYSSAGDVLWSRSLRALDLPERAAADATGFYLLVEDLQVVATVLRKYDTAGNELWSHRIEPRPNPNLFSLATDGTAAYVAAPILTETFTVLPGQCKSGSGSDSYIRKFDSASGEELWSREFGTSQASWAKGVAVAGGAVYVVGENGTAQVRDDFEHVAAFAPANPTRAGFIARFEAATASPKTGPRIFPDCVVNSASYVGGGVAPREMVTIFGAGMGPSDLVPLQLNPDRKLATTLGGARVLFNGVAAPLLYVSDGQSSAIVPAAVAGASTVDVQVEYNGVRSEAVTVPVLDARPGVFSLDGSGEGQAAILNEDGRVNSSANPAPRGSVITLYATGGAELAPGVEDGQIIGDVLPRTSLPVSAMFDLGTNEFPVAPKSAEVLYAGGVPGSVAGLLQINLRVPGDAEVTGSQVPFLLIIGSHWTVYQVSLALH